MTHRVKWDEDLVKNSEDNEIPNKCVIVWKVSSIILEIHMNNSNKRLNLFIIFHFLV